MDGKGNCEENNTEVSKRVTASNFNSMTFLKISFK